MVLCATSVPLTVLSEAAVGQATSTPVTQPATRFIESQFSQGSWAFGLNGTFAKGHSHRKFEQFVGGQAGIGYYLFDRISANLDVPVYWVDQSGPRTIGSGFDLLARWHFIESGGLSFYIDGGAGLFLTVQDVPRGGTQTNFTPQVGLGTTYFLDEHTYIFGGGRLWHLSNAGIDGHARNPSLDQTLMAYLGIGWTF